MTTSLDPIRDGIPSIYQLSCHEFTAKAHTLILIGEYYATNIQSVVFGISLNSPRRLATKIKAWSTRIKHVQHGRLVTSNQHHRVPTTNHEACSASIVAIPRLKGVRAPGVLVANSKLYTNSKIGSPFRTYWGPRVRHLLSLRMFLAPA